MSRNSVVGGSGITYHLPSATRFCLLLLRRLTLALLPLCLHIGSTCTALASTSGRGGVKTVFQGLKVRDVLVERERRYCPSL